MLTILMGRAKTGKSDAVLGRIRELGDSSRQILLVPEHASHQAEVDLCRFCGNTASRHAEVLSFRRLGDRVLGITGGLAQVTLDAGGKLLTLQKAMGEVAPMLRVYRRPSRKAAFLQQMLDLLDELRCYEVTPQVLEEQSRAIPGATGEKLWDLSLLYAAYEARLLRPGFDARDRMSKLCDHLEESGYVRDKDIFLDGFTYFNAQERRVLEVMLRQARSVTVTLLADPARQERGALSCLSADLAVHTADDVAHRVQGLDGVVRHFHLKLVLQRHHQIHQIQAVSAEVVQDVAVHGDLVGLDIQLLGQAGANLLKRIHAMNSP